MELERGAKPAGELSSARGIVVTGPARWPLRTLRIFPFAKVNVALAPVAACRSTVVQERDDVEAVDLRAVSAAAAVHGVALPVARE